MLSLAPFPQTGRQHSRHFSTAMDGQLMNERQEKGRKGKERGKGKGTHAPWASKGFVPRLCTQRCSRDLRSRCTASPFPGLFQFIHSVRASISLPFCYSANGVRKGQASMTGFATHGHDSRQAALDSKRAVEDVRQHLISDGFDIWEEEGGRWGEGWKG